MLVVSLKTNEWLRVTNEDGSEIDVVVRRIDGDKVRIGVEAAQTKLVLRGELIEKGFQKTEGNDD